MGRDEVSVLVRIDTGKRSLLSHLKVDEESQRGALDGKQHGLGRSGRVEFGA